MDSLPQALIKKLNIIDAVGSELTAVRNLIPPEPWTDILSPKRKEIAAWISTLLASRYHPTSSVLTNAKKAGYGIRPVPTISLVDRIIYRSLVEYILKNYAVSSRSKDEYRRFVIAPIAHARSRIIERKKLEEEGLPTIRPIRYVVEADITAFYQYIDHEVLRRELELQTGEIEAIGYLIQFLAELEGRTFGLPQLLDPSDQLSEVHIGIVERDLIRRGLVLWRFNDDFRIACESYSDALSAIEMLAESSRAIGLVIADHKTYTPSIRTYMKRALRSEPDNLEADSEDDIEQAELNDYFDPGGEKSIEEALTALQRISLDPEDPDSIDLKNTKREEVTVLRNAIASLTRHESDLGLSYVIRLFNFVPSLTPEIANYLILMYEGNKERVEKIWDMTSKHSSSEWQSLWLIYISRKLGIAATPSRTEWIKSQRDKGYGRLIHGEAELALAAIAASTFPDLDRALRMESQALAPWYILAIKELVTTDMRPTDRQITAIKESSRLYKWLMDG